MHGTDEPDRLEVVRLADGTVDVRLYPGAAGAIAVADGNADGREQPYFHRRFVPAETDEVRVYLHDGDDRAVVRGEVASDMVVRVIGGHGDNVLVDSAIAAGGRGRTVLYDAYGENVFVTGPDTRVDRRPFRFDPAESVRNAGPESAVAVDAQPAPPDETPPGADATADDDADNDGGRPYGNDEWVLHKIGEDRYRDYGSSLSWRPTADFELGTGLVVGFGPVETQYGFRRVPYASRVRLTGLFAPGPFDFGIELDGDIRRENSPFGLSLRARAVQFGAVRFFGFGNDTPEFDTDRATVRQNELSTAVTLDWRPRDRARVSVGPAFVYRDPHFERGSTLHILRPRGSSAFGQVGAIVDGELERTDGQPVPRRGFTVHAGAGLWPFVGGSADEFADLAAVAAYYLPLRGPTGPVIAFLAGGERVWGDFPVQEAAFIGGRHSLRGYVARRFAGDASLFGSAELRWPITRVTLLTAGELGALAFGDAARVFFDGDSDDGWHAGVGVGLWYATLGQVVSAAIARGERTRLYAWLGLPYEERGWSVSGSSASRCRVARSSNGCSVSRCRRGSARSASSWSCSARSSSTRPAATSSGAARPSASRSIRIGTRVLGVDVRERETGGVVRRRHAESEVPAMPPSELFAGESEPARVVRALTDPARLEVVLELGVTRRLRVASAGGAAPARVLIAYDVAAVRRGDTTAELYEVEIRMPEAPPGRFEGLVQAFEEGYGLRPLLGDLASRARELVSALEGDELAKRLHAAREVAVVAYDNGRIALCRSGGEGLRVPTGPGSGATPATACCAAGSAACAAGSASSARLPATASTPLSRSGSPRASTPARSAAVSARGSHSNRRSRPRAPRSSGTRARSPRSRSSCARTSPPRP